MINKKKRYYVDVKDNYEADYRNALAYARELSEKNSNVEQITLYFYTKKLAIRFLSGIFNDRTANKLYNGNKYQDCRAKVKIETQLTHNNNSQNQIVVYSDINEIDLFKYDDFSGINTIIAVPSKPKKIKNWVMTWGATELTTQVQAQIYPEPSAILKEALKELSVSFIKTETITHPDDENIVKTYVRVICKYCDNYNINEMVAYMLRELGFSAVNVLFIKELFNKLKTGSYFHGGKTEGLKGYYKRWASNIM